LFALVVIQGHRVGAQAHGFGVGVGSVGAADLAGIFCAGEVEGRLEHLSD
jgi:hypothetical protein